MKIRVSLLLTSSLLAAACTGAQENNVDVQADASSPAATYNYRCQSGEMIAAIYPTSDTATIDYQGNSYRMRIVVSASGARYLGEGLEWWTKGVGLGSSGTLSRHIADDLASESIEFCTGL